jgi:hypothetical protein
MQSKAKPKAQAKPIPKQSQAIMLISAYPSQKAQVKIQDKPSQAIMLISAYPSQAITSNFVKCHNN